MTIKKILLKDAGVKVFSYLCVECGSNNFVYLADSFSERQTSGARCKHCFEVTWCNGGKHPVLQLLSKPPVRSGVQYQVWRKQVLDDFLDSFGECPNCHHNGGYDFVSNKPLMKYSCSKCNHINERPELNDVTSMHANDCVLWNDL